MSIKSLALEEQRSRLERRVNVIRSRLLRTIDALDMRRDQVTEIVHHARRLAVPIGAAFLGAVVVTTAGTTFAIRALVERRRERKLGYRLSKAIAPFRSLQRPPFWQEALRKIALAALGVIASELVKRGAKVMIQVRPSQLPSGLASASPALLPAASAPTPLLGR